MLPCARVGKIERAVQFGRASADAAQSECALGSAGKEPLKMGPQKRQRDTDISSNPGTCICFKVEYDYTSQHLKMLTKIAESLPHVSSAFQILPLSFLKWANRECGEMESALSVSRS